MVVHMSAKGGLIFRDYIEKLGWGTHLCSIYRDKAEQLSVVAPYFAFGLQHNEKCVCIVGEAGQEDVCRALGRLGIDTENYIRQGQLSFRTKEESYLRDEFFSPLAMLDLIEQTHYSALKAGYSGLRASGELNWVAQDFPGTSRVIDYEREANFLFRHNRLIALCQYNEKVVPENILLGVMHTHPKTVIHGRLYDNPFFVPPDIHGRQADKEYPPGEYYKLRDSLITV